MALDEVGVLSQYEHLSVFENDKYEPKIFRIRNGNIIRFLSRDVKCCAKIPSVL